MLFPNLKPLSNGFYNIYIFNFIYRTPDVYIQKKKKIIWNIKSRPSPRWLAGHCASRLPCGSVCEPMHSWGLCLPRGQGGGTWGICSHFLCDHRHVLILGHIFSVCKKGGRWLVPAMRCFALLSDHPLSLTSSDIGIPASEDRPSARPTSQRRLGPPRATAGASAGVGESLNASLPSSFTVGLEYSARVRGDQKRCFKNTS